MATKTLSALVLAVVLIFALPVLIGVFGMVFGIIGGVFGAVFGVIGGILGGIFGAFGWIFESVFGGGFITFLVIVLLVVALTKKNR